MDIKSIYLASGFNRRHELRGLTPRLIAKGYFVCSSWIWIEERPDKDAPFYSDFAKKIANINFLDLLQADMLVVDAYGIMPDNNGGVHFETGFMVARDKPVYLIGPRGNSFHYLDNIQRVENYEELLALL